MVWGWLSATESASGGSEAKASCLLLNIPVVCGVGPVAELLKVLLVVLSWVEESEFTRPMQFQIWPCGERIQHRKDGDHL